MAKSNRSEDDEIYTRGVERGAHSTALEEFCNNIDLPFFPTTRAEEIYDKGFKYGLEHKSEIREAERRETAEREQIESVKSNSGSSGSNSSYSGSSDYSSDSGSYSYGSSSSTKNGGGGLVAIVVFGLAAVVGGIFFSKQETRSRERQEQTYSTPTHFPDFETLSENSHEDSSVESSIGIGMPYPWEKKTQEDKEEFQDEIHSNYLRQNKRARLDNETRRTSSLKKKEIQQQEIGFDENHIVSMSEIGVDFIEHREVISNNAKAIVESNQVLGGRVNGCPVGNAVLKFYYFPKFGRGTLELSLYLPRGYARIFDLNDDFNISRNETAKAYRMVGQNIQSFLLSNNLVDKYYLGVSANDPLDGFFLRSEAKATLKKNSVAFKEALLNFK